jgi:GAF domain-containing protein
MAEIINLRQVRKAKARAERERDAEANRRLFGRTKSERRLAESESEKAARDLEAHRLDRARDEVDKDDP